MGNFPGGNIIRVTPVLSTTPAYSNHDVFFNATEIPNAVSYRGGVSKLLGVTLLDKADTDHDFDLIFMQVSTDLANALNVAVGTGSLWTNALASAAKVIGILQVDHGDSNIDLINNMVWSSFKSGPDEANSGNNLPMLLQAEGGSTSVYVAGVSRTSGGALNPAADDYEFAFHVEYLG